MKNKNEIVNIIPDETLMNKICIIRGKKVILDIHLSELYNVPTKVLNQSVKRNIKRFPQPLFMFQLSKNEFENWRSQFVTSKKIKMGLRKCPYAFTEQGVAMLSSVLNSERAIQVNIQIIIIFTKIREMLASHVDLKRKIEDMEKKYDKQFQMVFDAIKELLEPISKKPKKEIGFHAAFQK